MKKVILYIFLSFVLLFGIFLLVTKGGIGHQKSGGIGYSETIEESKKRGVFVMELDYKVESSDSIKVVEELEFFMEKSFRYGERSTNDTDTLSATGHIYQIGREPSYDDALKGAFLLRYGYQNELKDTIICEIVTKTPPYDSIYKVGELKLFKKHD
ncbi:hypothetical protein KIM67_17960 [Flagellimonas sp. 389]|uniref:hypothetical protein n=1 Tax=Flagellimonas sp. 389 TaxID=2835862 RepID=UPI001BD60F71|nr:hypothetical protein [Flagellimonas sp. 389]MBS9464314.1 hypothetical protein [Flagellimonas sp. 389]